MSIWRHRPDPAHLNAIHRNTAVAQLGIAITAVGDDWLRGTMPVDARTVQPYGLLHGGSSLLFAETLASAASMACVDPAVELAVGVDISATHARSVRAGQVTGTARAVHLGGSIQIWEVRIEDDAGQLVSIVRQSSRVVPRRPAAAPKEEPAGGS